jgi:Trypsin
MPRLAAIACILLWSLPAAAIVGGAAAGDPTGPGRHVVMIVGSRGNSCSGVAIARDLVLTAAHCVLPGAEYKLVEFDAARRPLLKDIAKLERHPGFDLNSLLGHRATADVALLKLAEPLPASVSPAALSVPSLVQAGDHLIVAGAGLAVRGEGKSGGTVRVASLVATGRPGNLQIRLVDPATRGETAGAGACTGDSGAPVFQGNAGRETLIGIVSWSTGPRGTEGCGGLTGVTPLTLYRTWIVEEARKLGSNLDDAGRPTEDRK